MARARKRKPRANATIGRARRRKPRRRARSSTPPRCRLLFLPIAPMPRPPRTRPHRRATASSPSPSRPPPPRTRAPHALPCPPQQRTQAPQGRPRRHRRAGPRAASARLFAGNLASPCRSPCSVMPPSLPLVPRAAPAPGAARGEVAPSSPGILARVTPSPSDAAPPRLPPGCGSLVTAAWAGPGCGALTLIFLLPFWMWNSIAQQFFSAPILHERLEINEAEALSSWVESITTNVNLRS